MTAAVATLPADHQIGANNPPDPFGAHEAHIAGLYEETRNWLDGSEIASDAEADRVQQLLRMAQEAFKAADAARVQENEPFDLGKAAVQAKWAPLIANTKAIKGLTVKIEEGCKAVLGEWLKKVRAKQEAEAKALRDAAAKAAQEAADALQASAGNLEAREDAEEAVLAARRAESQARAAETARPQAQGYGRAATLRDNFVPVLTDLNAAVRHYWSRDPAPFEALVLQLAKADVAAGHRTIAGFTVENRPSVV